MIYYRNSKGEYMLEFIEFKVITDDFGDALRVKTLIECGFDASGVNRKEHILDISRPTHWKLTKNKYFVAYNPKLENGSFSNETLEFEFYADSLQLAKDHARQLCNDNGWRFGYVKRR